jgi:hypothetical protein
MTPAEHEDGQVRCPATWGARVHNPGSVQRNRTGQKSIKPKRLSLKAPRFQKSATSPRWRDEPNRALTNQITEPPLEMSPTEPDKSNHKDDCDDRKDASCQHQNFSDVEAREDWRF